LTTEQLTTEYEVPEYLPYTKLMLEHRDTFAVQFKGMLVRGYQVLEKGGELEVLDFVGTFLLALQSEELQETLVKELDIDDFLEFYHCAKHIELTLKKYKGHNTIRILDAVLFMHQCHRIRPCRSMSFLSDVYCFEQDYNLILAKTSKITKIITKKYEQSLTKLYTKRKHYKQYFISYLPEDFIKQQEEELFRCALEQEIDLLRDVKERKKAEKKEVLAKKPKEKTVSYDFKMRGRDKFLVNVNDSASEPEEESVFKISNHAFYRPNFSSKLQYMASTLLDIFLEHSKNTKDITDGRELYAAGLNHHYREYTATKGGYNLFDAIEFKKFNRIDLYAENVLSVMDNLTLYAKHNYLVETLTLLMVQYRALEEPKGFALKLTANELKYLEGLSFKESVAKEKENPVKNLTHDEVNYRLSNG
jgi:hypothetical protein